MTDSIPGSSEAHSLYRLKFTDSRQQKRGIHFGKAALLQYMKYALRNIGKDRENPYFYQKRFICLMSGDAAHPVN